jgi:SAM-dependent methyltransferase
MRLVGELFGLTSQSRVLDVGGTWLNWSLLDVRPRLTLLNLFPRPDDLPSDVEYIQANACDTKLPDGSFDLVYSNSVIEHLFTRENQLAMAGEVRRLGKSYFVQTPNWWFPFEPHYMTPLVHYTSPRWQKRLLRWCSVWGLLGRPSQDFVNKTVDEIQLLTARQMREFFPDAEIHYERFCGLAKSIMAVRR